MIEDHTQYFLLILALVAALLVYRWLKGIPDATSIVVVPAGTTPPAGTPTPSTTVITPVTVPWYKEPHVRIWKIAKSNPKVAKKVATVVWVVLLAYALVLSFFPGSRSFLLSPGGIVLLLLAIVGYSTFVIIKAVFWDESPFTAAILMLVIIAILEPGIAQYIPVGTLSHLSFWSGSMATPECPGTKEFIEFGTAWTDLLKGKTCRIIHEIEGEIEFADERGPYLAQGWQNRIPIKGHAPSGHASMYYGWCPLETGTILLTWGCVPKSS